MNNQRYRNRVKRWMLINLSRFVDECNEVNTTAMVEAWDNECGTGLETLADHHPAWEIASEMRAALAPRWEEKKDKQ